MRKYIHTALVSACLLLSSACGRELERVAPDVLIPDGTPATLGISFGSQDLIDLSVSTKAESSEADEARVHDLYVFIFDSEGNKKYGRFFSYEHQTSTLAALDANTNEGWFVANKTINGVTNPISTTTGAVKISTETCSNATLVLIANVSNSVSSFNGEDDGIAYLNGISTLEELRATKVILEQDVVNRNDLFLKLGVLEGVNTAEMVWGTLPQNYDANYKVSLNSVDAKVKFLVKCDSTNISATRAVYWQVYNAPDRCYLFSDYASEAAPDDVVYFDSEQTYFEGTETVDGDEWYVFTFYMMESRFDARQAASSYYDREVKEKTDAGESGYAGPTSDTYGSNYVDNGDWLYADEDAAYVKFDMILTLTDAGIYSATNSSVNNALTTDAIFTVHLGDFSHAGIDDYNTLRSHNYTYKITINNSGSIFAEVENDTENQAGQEGFLILTDDEIVNADCHYEYHTITFTYNSAITSSMFSWYVKTPFSEGQPTKFADPDDAEATLYDGDGLDYLWVKFRVNVLDGNSYVDERTAYPGDSEYDPDWKPSSGDPVPALMDISQLLEFYFNETRKKTNGETNVFDTNNQIKVTAFIDEYYYDKHPLTGEVSEDLWRSFVNAKPREMHILSNARASRDRNSDVIDSSHSIIQESIQTIYNIYAPGLRNLWGCEHMDEMKDEAPDGWVYWQKTGYGSSVDCPLSERAGANNDLGKYNGRLNTGYIWYVYSSNNASGTVLTDKDWNTFLDYTVDNDTPELREEYQAMAFSCMTRNRDNNG
ncbi:MAG: hypothetical protein K6F21_01915, partial [Bacteroidales bacterium]|nr:hypothetical protein [Bacteroidales bacterium]